MLGSGARVPGRRDIESAIREPIRHQRINPQIRTPHSAIVMSLKSIRRDYSSATLLEEEADFNPFRQFARWFDEVLGGTEHDPTAMTLATSSRAGRPGVYG